jgi:hypothetical protein
MLANDAELWEIFIEDPERGMLLYNIKYLRDNVSAEMATTFFGEVFDEAEPSSDRPGLTPEQEARLQELNDTLNERFAEEYPDYVPSQFSAEWQGAGTVPWERPQETVDLFPEFYGLLRNEQALHNDLLNRIATADILDLEFEEMLIERFITLVEHFKTISEEVEVVLLPRNTAWVTYTPEVEARLQAVLDRIAEEAGVPVRNHQDLEVFNPEMFTDTTHLARYLGDIPWTEYLASQYCERLTAVDEEERSGACPE